MAGSDPYAQLADPFLEHYQTLRGVVRLELVCRQLGEHLPEPPAQVLDVGGGGGRLAARLATQGYDVVIADPSAAMLRKAEALLATLPGPVANRVRLTQVSGCDAPAHLGEDRFDAVCCHGVLAYLEYPKPTVGALIRLAKPGAVVSILTKHAAALALRPALQGRWADAVAAIDTDRDVGTLGAVTRGDTVEGLESMLADAGANLVDWYGVRVLTDHLGPVPPGPELALILEAEWHVSSRDPYRAVSRMIHVIAQRS